MADASRTVDIIFKGTNEIEPVAKSIEESLDKIPTSAEKAATGVDSSTKKINTAFKSTKEGTDSVVKNVDDVAKKTIELEGAPIGAIDKYGKAIAALGLLIAGALVAEFIKINQKVEQFTKSIDFATGSAGEGAKQFDYLVDASKRLGLSVLGATDGYKALFLATEGTNVSVDNVRKIFEAVSGTIQAMGEDASLASSILEKMGNALGDGKVTFEELNSIVEKLPGGLTAFANAIDRPVESIKELAKQGKLGKDEILLYAEALTGKLPTGTDDLSSASNKLKTAIVELNVELAKSGAYQLLIDGVNLATESVDGLVSAVEFVKDNIQFVPQIWIPTTFFNAYKDAGEAVYDFGKNILESQGLLGPAKTELEKFAGAIQAVNDIEFKGPDNAFGSFGVLANQANDTILVLRDSMNELKRDNGDLWNLEPLQDFQEELDDVVISAAEMALELEKLASNERIKRLEFKAELDIAEVEANAKKVVAAFDSITAGIESTGQLLGDLFGNLGDADNFRELFAIEDQIELENERREKELALQKKLTEATIREMEARTKRLNSGDAAITINGDGLQPHLEAFMWEILETIQVRVNADGLDMLLGAP